VQARVAHFGSAKAPSTLSVRDLNAAGEMVKHFDTKNSSIRLQFEPIQKLKLRTIHAL
jgi:hypothetical protein